MLAASLEVLAASLEVLAASLEVLGGFASKCWVLSSRLRLVCPADPLVVIRRTAAALLFFAAFLLPDLPQL